MNTAEDASVWYNQAIQEQLKKLPQQQAWLKRIKQNAGANFLQQGFPNRKQEEWRYANLKKLLQHSFVPAERDVASATNINVNTHFIPHLDSYRLVFMNNQYRADLSSVDQLPQGVTIQSLQQIAWGNSSDAKQWLESSTIHPINSFTALNAALMSDGIVISLDKYVELKKPIELLFMTSTRENAVISVPRILVALSTGAKAVLIERFCGTGPLAYFQNVVEEIVLEPHSTLDHYRLLEEQRQSFHLSNISIRQKEGSRYKSLNLELTGSFLRTDFHIDMQGRSAECELNGLYVVDNGQQSDVHIDVKHHAPDCKSRQHYKGLLLGEGRAVFDGKIVVYKDAQQTDAHMSNDNLILCEHAEVDSKPQLEIYADNVKCSHGTTVGQLDPEQLFYLRSRGIEKGKAFRMLCQGYVAEILANCNIDALRDFIDERFQCALNQEQQTYTHRG